MSQIFKYFVEITGKQEIEMPGGAEILCCQVQHNKPCIWAIVDPDARAELKTILIAGTGHEIDFDLSLVRYIGTIQMGDGTLVLHVFEQIQK